MFKSCNILAIALLAVLSITSSTLCAQDDAVRKLIVDGSAAGAKPNVYVNVLGKLSRVQLLSADDKGISISFMDNPFPIAWKEIPPEHLGPIASEFAKTGNDHLLLVQFYAANNLSALAEKAGLAAVDKDKSLAAEVGTLLNGIKKPDAPVPPPAANSATPATEQKADPKNGASVATGFPSAPSGNGPRQNHEGRTLPPLPDFKTPIWFDTPEADIICAAMQVFPKDNAWNEDISKRPVHPDSAKIIANIGATDHLKVDFSMNFVLVPQDQQMLDVKLRSKESDPGPYPVPPNAPIEGLKAWGKDRGSLDDLQRNGDGDRHCLVIDPFHGMEYEFFQMRKTDAGWTAGCEATFNFASNKLRPKAWTSADAAGLSIFAGTIRHDEVERGMVEHAIRLTVSKTRKEFIYPATHYASPITDPTVAAMGQRLRLKAGADLSGLPKDAMAIALALKKYGLIVADNGTDWFICATSDKRWNFESVKALQRFKGNDFEVIVTTTEHEPPRSGGQ